ncbi:MAG TPA: hypothetical protein VN636_10980, partial [Acidimicrobiia bacterium]|nr:hypothetical protein [Acidimicrobiia bacterium]
GSRPVAATTEPLPAGVSVHPEAFRGLGRLAYASGNRVVILDGAGGAPQSFAFPGAVQRVRFSFDGVWLAAGIRPGAGDRGELFVVRAGATTPTRVPVTAAADWDWSPVRDVIAIVDQSLAPPARSGTIEFFAPPDVARPLARPVPLEFPEGFLSWSPDGNRLVVKSYTVRAPFLDALWSIDTSGCPPACGSVPRPVRVDVRSGYGGDVGYLPAGWSGDGTRLLIWLDDAHSGSVMMDGLTLASIAVDGGPGARLPTMLAKPSWIANVARTAAAIIAVGGDRMWDAPRRLDACNLATGACSAIVDGPGQAIDPSVSPDGTRLAYVATDPIVFADPHALPPASSIRWSRSRRLVVTDLSGRGPRVVATGGVVAPRFALDGRHLVFWRARYLWIVDSARPAPVAIAGPLAARADDLGFGPFEQSPYILPGDDVWDSVDWLRTP